MKRYGKRYVPTKPVTLLTALALRDQEHHVWALVMLRAEGLDTDRAALDRFAGEEAMAGGLFGRLRTVRLLGSLASHKSLAEASFKPRANASPRPVVKTTLAKRQPVSPLPVALVPPMASDLPKLEARFDMAFEIANPAAIEIRGVLSGFHDKPMAAPRKGSRRSLSEAV